MKKLLLTGIAALLLAMGTAHAAKDDNVGLPPAFTGKWCLVAEAHDLAKHSNIQASKIKSMYSPDQNYGK